MKWYDRLVLYMMLGHVLAMWAIDVYLKHEPRITKLEDAAVLQCAFQKLSEKVDKQ